jgi:hypothetical protein
MAGAIQLTEVDFQQIKDNLVNYLKSTDKFTDYDFEGSNLQVILNLIAYQAQMNAYSTNMIANESFLASASLRDNVVSNASQIGYLPVSTRSAFSEVSFQYSLDSAEYPSGFPQYLQIEPGPLFTTGSGGSNLIFNSIDQQTAAVSGVGLCKFDEIRVYEGTYLTSTFVVDESIFNQRFILENGNIDTTTIRVEVQEDPSEEINEPYSQANNLVNTGSTSRVYWITEVNDTFYELKFGDGFFGNKLQNGATITVSYLISNGVEGNGVTGVSNYVFIGQSKDNNGSVITDRATVTATTPSNSGADVESVSSIKFRAPRSYSAQNRCVVAEDYETIVRRIYPAVDDVYVFGGEELSVPQYGRVYISIKPKTGAELSNLTKNYIKKSLDSFRVASLDIIIVNADVLYVEVISTVYYDDKRTNKDASAIRASVNEVLSEYSNSSTVSKFGGAIRYSRVVGIIDDADKSITRNNSEFRMRKDMIAILDTVASYEVCFENQLQNISGVPSVYSSGFQLEIDGVTDPKTYYFEDDSKGNIHRFYFNDANVKVVVDKNFGTVDYTNGEVLLGYSTPFKITGTSVDNIIIQIRGIPHNQDVIAEKTVYAEFDDASSSIFAVVDQQISGS